MFVCLFVCLSVCMYEALDIGNEKRSGHAVFAKRRGIYPHLHKNSDISDIYNISAGIRRNPDAIGDQTTKNGLKIDVFQKIKGVVDEIST